jgi:hypothetical protein
MNKNDEGNARPNCFTCLHFFVTHEPAHPYGCRAMGFKSAQLPTMTVYISSGIHCQTFVPKHKKTGP